MKKITLLFLATFALVANEAISQIADQDKKPAVIFVEDGDQQTVQRESLQILCRWSC